MKAFFTVKNNMARAFCILVCLMVTVSPGRATAGTGDGCRDDSERYIIGAGIGMVAGGMLAGGGLTATAVATGAGATVICGPAMPLCILAMLAGGGAGIIWAAVTSENDCAGAWAWAGGRAGRYWHYVVSNRDSTKEAREDVLAYCQEQTGLECELWADFRKCSALAKSSSEAASEIGLGLGRTATLAERDALGICRRAGGERCRVEHTFCNRG